MILMIPGQCIVGWIEKLNIICTLYNIKQGSKVLLCRAKHCENWKRCPENILLVVRVNKLTFVIVCILSQFQLSFVTISVLSFITIWVFELLSNYEFCNILSFWVKSKVEFFHNLSLVKFLVFRFHHNLSISVSSQFKFLSFITIWVLECHDPLSFWVSSQFEVLW